MGRRLSRKEKQALNQIKEKLSSDFKAVRFKQIGDIPDLAYLLVGGSYSFNARIDEENIIHYKIETSDGVELSGTTNGYIWFMENVDF